MAKARRTPATDTDTTVVEAAKPRRSRAAKPAAEAVAKPAAPRRAKAAKPAEPAPPKPAGRSRAKAAVASDAAPRKRAPKPAATAPAAPPMLIDDQPLGQAAQEIAQIRAQMRYIRQMVDSRADVQPDAHAMLQRLCQDASPRAILSGTTASVIELRPHARRAAVVEDAPRPRVRRAAAGQGVVALTQPLAEPLPDLIAEAAPELVASPFVEAEVPPALPRRRSRMMRLLSAWGDWLMWRLMPPTMSEAPTSVAPALTAPHPVELQAAPAPVPPAVPEVPVAQIVTQTVDQIMDDAAMRARLKEMIREELEGEMGARFSGNLRAVVRREVAAALDDRLTHL
ncbi:hypothetical protein [Paracoccus sp. ME4]|uniref:hypothetical protein n=1 Tax=Paracoccus sp. ME4 TaxID=3138066 RepID=UPI00398AC83E